MPPSEKATEAVRENWKLVKKSGRKLAVSAAKILASAALKHGAGLSIGDILQTESTDVTDETGGDASEDLSDSVEKLAEQLGAQLEKEYKARQHSISAFRENLERTVALLAKHGVVGAPLAVFVDELDRCRPDFAIKLLEVIKHLFDVPGVCFVVSINTLQLSESIRAVYGGGFDASHYLHRFFDLTYQLPAPDCYRFAKTLFAGWPENLRKMSRDAYVYSTLNGEDTQAHLFAAVSREFGLDLRAQKRVFETALAAAGGIPKDNPVHSMFLFFLSAMYVRRRAGWEAFWMKPTDLSAYQVWYLAQVRSLPTSTQLDDRNAQFETEIPNIDVRSVIYEYWRLATMSPEDLRAEVNAGRPDENRTLRRQILSAVSSRYGNSGRIAVYDYKVLIELAGQVV